MNKIYLITGVTSDLAISFLKKIDSDNGNESIRVYGTYNNNSNIAYELKDSLNCVELIPVKCNLGVESDIQNLIAEIGENVPTHFVHLAAKKVEYMRISEFDWQRTKDEMDVQVGAFALLLKWILPKMTKNKYGRIVAIGTSYTLGTPPKFLSNYILIKHALYGLVKAVAVEYAGKNITCNVISPDMMETKFLSQLDKRTAEINAKGSAMKRNVALDEVVASMIHLLSDEASYINGINLNISGGKYM